LPAVSRGEIWEVDFEPQTHKEEPGKRRRPALVLQTDLLNDAKHPTTIVVPGTTDIYRDASGDGFPLRVAIGKPGRMAEETDLLVDQIRTISNQRFLGAKAVAVLGANHMKRVMDALRILTT
jgi:mRNA interferase MazF